MLLAAEKDVISTRNAKLLSHLPCCAALSMHLVDLHPRWSGPSLHIDTCQRTGDTDLGLSRSHITDSPTEGKKER